MSIAPINSWLNANGLFSEGVALLKRYGTPSSTDLFIYSLRENSVSRERLRTQLAALLAPAVAVVAKGSKALPARPAPKAPPAVVQSGTDRTDITVDMLPPELKPLRIAMRDKYAARLFLRGTMARIPDGMELRRVAAKVLLLDREMREGWRTLETWQRTGVVLQKEEPLPPTQANVLQRRNNLRTYISRHVTGKRPLKEDKLKAYQAELEKIEAQLNETVDH